MELRTVQPGRLRAGLQALQRDSYMAGSLDEGGPGRRLEWLEPEGQERVWDQAEEGCEATAQWGPA